MPTKPETGPAAGVDATMLLAIAALILASDLIGDIVARIAVPETLIEYWPMLLIGLSLFRTAAARTVDHLYVSVWYILGAFVWFPMLYVVGKWPTLTGVESALRTPPDLVLVDLGLPTLDGYEVARQVRAVDERRGILLVAVTGYGAPEDRERSLMAGFDLHLVKPVDPERLARFEREAMVAANIDHPNVAAATDFGKLPDGSMFLVLEFVEGKSLRDEISAGPLPFERALRIAGQIAAAVGSAHALRQPFETELVAMRAFRRRCTEERIRQQRVGDPALALEVQRVGDRTRGRARQRSPGAIDTGCFEAYWM